MKDRILSDEELSLIKSAPGEYYGEAVAKAQDAKTERMVLEALKERGRYCDGSVVVVNPVVSEKGWLVFIPDEEGEGA